MSKYTPGPWLQAKRPRRWGIPSPTQWALLVSCAQRGGSRFLEGAPVSTMRACQQRGWLTVSDPQYRNDDWAMAITEQGKACLVMNAADSDAMRAAIGGE